MSRRSRRVAISSMFFVMTYLLLERPYVRRLVEGRDNLRGRGVRDEGSQETLDVILDEYLLCHLGLSNTLDSQRTLVYAIADALQPTRHKSLAPLALIIQEIFELARCSCTFLGPRGGATSSQVRGLVAERISFTRRVLTVPLVEIDETLDDTFCRGT